jgi:hypothetical protein
MRSMIPVRRTSARNKVRFIDDDVNEPLPRADATVALDRLRLAKRNAVTHGATVTTNG